LKNSLLWALFPVLWTVFLVLLLSNDVKLNPGPVRFLCSVYYKSVRVNQRALQCDTCAYWCHCACCGVDIAVTLLFRMQWHLIGFVQSVLLT